MEFDIPNFKKSYASYRENKDLLVADSEKKKTTNKKLVRMMKIYEKFQDFDVKLRLAFAIKEIILNNNFVSNKQDDLKECHLLYYKLADLWFAYETYLGLYKYIFTQEKEKVCWLDLPPYESYKSDSFIGSVLKNTNQQLKKVLSKTSKKNNFSQYLNYSKTEASNSQKNRINSIIAKIEAGEIQFSHTEILTMTYANRNNFVHHGETTVVPASYSYREKVEFLRVFYTYLTIITLCSANITLRNRVQIAG